MVKGKSQFHDCPKCGAGGIIPDENGRCTHCGAVIGEIDTGSSASEREPTEPTIRQDRPSPVLQAELQPRPSWSCSIPGVIAGTLVIGLGVALLLIHKRDGMELAMNLLSSGALLFAGSAIIVRSFLGPFSLLKLFMVFFGALVLWLTVPSVLSDFRVAQAAVVKSEAYASLACRLFVVGLGILLLVFGFKRRKAVSCTTHGNR